MGETDDSLKNCRFIFMDVWGNPVSVCRKKEVVTYHEPAHPGNHDQPLYFCKEHTETLKKSGFHNLHYIQ